MSTQASSQYMLLIRGNQWDHGLTPVEIDKVMDRWTAWFDRLVEKGDAKAGQPLTNDSKLVLGKKTLAVVDGPFAESKETVAGYIILQVESLERAVELAKECPGLDYDQSIEVRPIDGTFGLAPA